MVLAPPPTTAELEGVDWIEATETTAARESVREALKELERRDLLVPRTLMVRGEGI
jgi:hypothetical protein